MFKIETFRKMGETKFKRKMKTKAKANTILGKKLEELECLLEEFGSGNGDLNAYREFKLRFLFTHTLLTAEISSIKDGEEEEEEMLKLRCMAKKLTELGDAFKKLTGPINETDMQSLESDGDIVNVDETCLVRLLVESLEEEYQGAYLEKKLEDSSSVARRKTERIKKKRLRGLVSFGVVGFVAGMVSIYGYLRDIMNEETIFPIPT